MGEQDAAGALASHYGSHTAAGLALGVTAKGWWAWRTAGAPRHAAKSMRVHYIAAQRGVPVPGYAAGDLDALAAAAGGWRAVARLLAVDYRTVKRWRSGQHALTGPLKASIAAHLALYRTKGVLIQ